MEDSVGFPQLSTGTVRIGTVAAIPRILQQLGYDPDDVLAELGIDSSLFDDPDHLVSYSMRSRLLRQCVQKTRCEHFGLLIGQQAGLPAFGWIGYLVQQSPTVTTALRTLVHYAHLHVRGGLICFEERDDDAFLGYSIYQPDTEAREQITDGAVAIAYNIMRQLAGPEWYPTNVIFSHRKPADLRPYKNFFKAPLRFNAGNSGVVFSRSWLQQPVPEADPELHRLLLKQVEQLAAGAGPGFVEEVQRVLHSVLITHKPTADQIAEFFSIHPRTLHRRLQAHETSFQQLVDKTRSEMARQMLESSEIEITEIGERLHYADASAFARAFRRWEGTTPAKWRQQNRNRQG
jgi:AraC-like DNA-binding protein